MGSSRRCIDCMNFLTRTLSPKSFATSKFKDCRKIEKKVIKHGRVTVFWCRVHGRVYLATHRVYKLKACDTHFDDVSSAVSLIDMSPPKMGPEMADF